MVERKASKKDGADQGRRQSSGSPAEVDVEAAKGRIERALRSEGDEGDFADRAVRKVEAALNGEGAPAPPDLPDLPGG